MADCTLTGVPVRGEPADRQRKGAVGRVAQASGGYRSPFHHSTLLRGAPIVSTSPISGVASVRR